MKSEGDYRLGEILDRLYKTKSYQRLDGLTNPILNNEKRPRKYPLTDIGLDAQDNLFVDVALPGFKREDVEIERIDDRLIIKGTNNFAEEIIEEYFEQNIIQDDFERVIVLDEKYQTGDVTAQMEHGLLTVMIAPKEKIVTKIEIK